MADKKKNNSFENNILRLEEISSMLEQDDVGLDKAIALFEEGVNLSRSCLTALSNAELKITELKKKITDIAAKDTDLFEK